MGKKETKLSLVDLFAGCGGLSLGMENAGFESVFVNELHPDALASYVINRPASIVQDPMRQSSDIQQITRNSKKLIALATHLKDHHGDIDLVAGGPPCQGFSGIGIRRTFDLSKNEIPTNHLYKDMAKFVRAVAPKAFLFENVRGLLTSRWTPEGSKGEIWQDVQNTFEDITVKIGKRTLSYKVGFELVFAKDFGVPQNRPRVIMIGVREDLDYGQLSLLEKGSLGVSTSKEYPHPYQLFSDLIDPNWKPGGVTDRYLKDPKPGIQEQLRLNHVTKKIMGKYHPISDHEYSKHSNDVVKKFQFMIENGGKIPRQFQTKKFAQRLLPMKWDVNGPNITATSLPDDYVHFSQPRVLTVREWARLQTFPDSYAFFGKRTTGGRRRAGDPEDGNWTRDLPKYTQIGNAVPIELARRLGNHIRKLIGED